MEVALTVAFFLTQFDPSLCNASVPNSQGQHMQHKQQLDSVKMVQADAKHGRCCAEGQTCTQIAAGDPSSFLPLPETRRQVGIRWPQTPCEVVLQS